VVPAFYVVSDGLGKGWWGRMKLRKSKVKTDK